ncbi:FAD-linked oxidoreductase ZEB1 [Colletotrichum siamense]|uniref:FAD-linked oxidoreductase ZEB1 n=1 Tax=Colletotrichum siamense TaxID=690259 RepID=UPI001872B7D3|nr:FAD-linked oxidoreductase ZEB1 [Colletotrichum siamense]KAF5504947.1 FAD-linked oxidoreductase ZEB1 [Colletotrichum siamense]
MPVMSPLMLGSIFLHFALRAAATVSDIKPAVEVVAATAAAGALLQSTEVQQLTEDVVTRIVDHETTAEYASYFTFGDDPVSPSTQPQVRAACKAFPGDPSWPRDEVWGVLDQLLGGALIPTKPLGAPCYNSQWGARDDIECANIIKNSANANFLSADPTANYWPIFQGRTCQPKNEISGSECTIGGYPEYAINVTSVAQIQLAVNFARAANLRLVIKNTGHCYLGKSLGAGALSLWMHNVKDIEYLPKYEGPGYSGPAMKLAAGVSVREVYEVAEQNNVTVLGAVSWSVGYAGGMITGGGQNPLAGIYGMAADHVVAFQIVTADGRFRTVSEKENPDLFWALCGGGGGTFGVITSVIIRAHPRMNVVTAKWTLDASNNSIDQFWKGVRKFYDEFLNWTDAGLYSFYIMWPTPQLSMNYMFAPNHTLDSYNEVVRPFFEYLEANNITLSVSHQSTAHTSFYSAYQATWGANQFPVGVDTSLPANRLVPRRNFVEKYEETYALIKSHVSSGKHFLGYHNAPGNAGPSVGNQNNAVNPAFREMVFFLVTSSNRTADHSTPAALATQNMYLQEQVLRPWREIAPVSEGGGTYLNEASVEESDWQESFYGGNYPRLSQIKRRWDPNDVFYAVTAVGSERWTVLDGDQGVQTQNGRLCRVSSPEDRL